MISDRDIWRAVNRFIREHGVEAEILDGSSVHLKAGDVLVQRGTVHNWITRGNAPCIIAVVLIAAKSGEVSGKTLHAQG